LLEAIVFAGTHPERSRKTTTAERVRVGIMGNRLQHGRILLANSTSQPSEPSISIP
jgi:hypothetical protein